MSEETQTVLCRMCKQAIPENATVCFHCCARQGWSKWFGASQVTLALLVALIAVVGGLAPVIQSTFFAKSDLEFNQPTVVEDRLRLIVTNNGLEPAVIEYAVLESRYFREPVDFRFDDERDAAVEPGINVVTGRLFPVMSAENATHYMMNEWAEIDGGSTDPKGQLHIGIIGSSGEDEVIILQVSGSSILELITQQAVRCGELPFEERSFRNGCVDPQMPIEIE